MDPLSDVLRAVRLDGAFFYLVEAAPPFTARVASALDLVPRVLPRADHLICYHILTSGSCWVGVDFDSLVEMRPGDAVIFPHASPHVMVNAPGGGAPVVDHTTAPARHLQTVRMGSGRPVQATFVCGFLGCEAGPFNPLLAALPKMMIVPAMTSGWLAEFPRQVVAESQQPRVGADTLLARMAELMFIEVIRRYIAGDERGQRGWLAGLRDPIVAPALSAMHSRPSHPWTLTDLARESAASRSVLAERFTETVGVPPMQYLTQWRLQLAAEQLTTSTDKVAVIGAKVGYESEAAFSRAFKKATGHAPASWRRSRLRGER